MATPIDMTPFISQIAFDGVVIALISIAAALAVVVLAQTGAGRALAMLMDKQEQRKLNKRYEARYERERGYAQYKKNRQTRSFVAKNFSGR